MKEFKLVMVAALLLLLTACATQDKRSRNRTDEAAQGAKQEARRAAEKTEAQKDEYERKLKAKLDDLDRSIDTLKARAKKTNARERVKLNEAIADLQKKRASAGQRFDELKSASARAWEDLKVGIEAAMDDLENACERAASHFK